MADKSSLSSSDDCCDAVTVVTEWPSKLDLLAAIVGRGLGAGCGCPK